MTQLQPRTETFSGTDLRWLGSREGMDTARTVTLDYASWTGKVTNGRLKSGEAVAFDTNAGTWVPYNSAGSNGTNAVSGFVLYDQPVITDAGDIAVPMLDRGRINNKYLPSAVAVDATQAATARFSFVDVTL